MEDFFPDKSVEVRGLGLWLRTADPGPLKTEVSVFRRVGILSLEEVDHSISNL